jgi:hypothetical protein
MRPREPSSSAAVSSSSSSSVSGGGGGDNNDYAWRDGLGELFVYSFIYTPPPPPSPSAAEKGFVVVQPSSTAPSEDATTNNNNGTLRKKLMNNLATPLLNIRRKIRSSMRVSGNDRKEAEVEKSLDNEVGECELVPAIRYNLLLYIQHVSVNSTTCCDINKFLALVRVWVEENALVRILYGHTMRCACTTYNHAFAHAVSLTEQHDRTTLFKLLGGNRYRFFLVSQRHDNNKMEGDNVYLDEYAVLLRVFQALTLPCNQARHTLCAEFSRWIMHKFRLIHESYRSKNLQMWERNIYSTYEQQCRVNSTLNYNLQQLQRQFDAVKENYENLLRLKSLKPTSI